MEYCGSHPAVEQWHPEFLGAGLKVAIRTREIVAGKAFRRIGNLDDMRVCGRDQIASGVDLCASSIGRRFPALSRQVVAGVVCAGGLADSATMRAKIGRVRATEHNYGAAKIAAKLTMAGLLVCQRVR